LPARERGLQSAHSPFQPPPRDPLLGQSASCAELSLAHLREERLLPAHLLPAHLLPAHLLLAHLLLAHLREERLP
jgi:hypothetical protein